MKNIIPIMLAIALINMSCGKSKKEEPVTIEQENQNIDLSTYTCIFKNENGTWKYAWMQRSQGTTDMKTWE